MKDVFGRVFELCREGKSFALATLISSEGSTPRSPGTRMIIFPDGTTEGTIGGGALEKRVIGDAVSSLERARTERFVYDLGKGDEPVAGGAGARFETGVPGETGVSLGMICGGKAEVFIEVFGGGMKIFIFGAGHVGKKLAELCGVLNIPNWVIDNREAYAREELFPCTAGVVHADFKESFRNLPIDENSYLVIVTYGHHYDGVCLEAALKTKARYIGMIGSRSKVRTLLDSLSKKGVDVSDRRIYAPIGLHLGDSTPEQISMSILSEILKLHSGGSGKHLRELEVREPGAE